MNRRDFFATLFGAAATGAVVPQIAESAPIIIKVNDPGYTIDETIARFAPPLGQPLARVVLHPEEPFRGPQSPAVIVLPLLSTRGGHS